MLGEICAEIKNYFVKNGDIHIGDWEISNGAISPILDFPTAYIRIVGSRLNDGVHKISEMRLVDESFHGGIWIMSPPAEFLALVKEIEDWQKQYGGYDAASMSPFTSESFGGYAYTKGAGSTTENSNVTGAPSWQGVYASRLKKYRRIREL